PLRLSPPAAAVRGLEHAFTMAPMRDRCPPSALYTFPAGLGLGSALARAVGPGRSPNLTGATPGVSPGGLKRSSSPLCLPIPPLGRGRRRASPAGRDWRPGSESNRRTRICSPLHDHSATRPVTLATDNDTRPRG